MARGIPVPIFKTKSKAKEAEAKRKEEILSPKQEKQTPTVMGFLELVNKRLDHVKAYNSKSYYRDHIYLARKWMKEWKQRSTTEIYLHSIGEAEREAMRVFEKMTEDSHTDSHTEKEKGFAISANPLN